jgi:hypothetical protein
VSEQGEEIPESAWQNAANLVDKAVGG